jgi:hypothetical protein
MLHVHLLFTYAMYILIMMCRLTIPQGAGFQLNDLTYVAMTPHFNQASQGYSLADLPKERKIQKLIYDALSPAMYSRCICRCSNTAVAEDALVNGFVLLFNKLHQYNEQVAFVAWSTCLFDEAIDACNSKQEVARTVVSAEHL